MCYRLLIKHGICIKHESRDEKKMCGLIECKEIWAKRKAISAVRYIKVIISWIFIDGFFHIAHTAHSTDSYLECYSIRLKESLLNLLFALFTNNS